MKVWGYILLAALMLSVGVWIWGSGSASPESKAPSAIHVTYLSSPAASVATTQGSSLSVSPTVGLEELRQKFVNDLTVENEKQIEYNISRKKWEDFKAGGGKAGGRDVKALEFYKNLSTVDLADDIFFSEPAFAVVSGLYDDPQYALIRLEVMHPGFAEFFGREDMAAGVLHAYETACNRLQAESDLRTVRETALTLAGFGILYQLPQFKKQVKANEREFLRAHVIVLDKMVSYLNVYSPERLGAPGPFFGEATRVARMALVLAADIDANKYASIEKEITSVRWSKEQKMEDLKSYLDLVSKRLKVAYFLELAPVKK